MFSRAQSRAASRGPSRAASTVAGRAMTPMINAETIESRIQAAVSRNWKKIQEQCRQLDVNSTGEIEVSQFKGQRLLYLTSTKAKWSTSILSIWLLSIFVPI